MKYKLIYFIISLGLIIPGTVSLFLFKLKPAIDFTGGTLWEFSLKDNHRLQITEADIKAALKDNSYLLGQIQLTDNSVIIRSQALSEEQHQQLKTALDKQLPSTIEELRFESIGPTLGQSLLKKTFTAITIASITILLFVAYRFKDIKYGLAAVIAMFHDSLILLGAFSLLGHFFNVEVDTLFVTAVLTILSFSVHDTIVVFDRIRESLKVHPQVDFTAIVNKSVTETLGRSVNNSMTIIFMLLALFLLGGETTKNFILALLIGTISGTYSSTFTAAPILNLLYPGK